MGGYLTLGGLEGCVRQGPSGQLVINLSGMRFVEPYGVVSLAAATQAAVDRGVPIMFTGPATIDYANYLSRLHFDRHLDALGIVHDLPQVNEQHLPERIAELRPFSSHNDVVDLARIVFRRLEEAMPTFGIGGEIYEALAEVCNNAVEHAQVEHGYAAAQVYNRGRPTQRIDFAIGDAGIGVKASLRAADYEVEDDVEAIELALTGDVTASREQGRGHGLPDTCTAILGLRGTIAIRTGASKIVRHGNRSTMSHAYEIPGTVVGASIPCGIGN